MIPVGWKKEPLGNWIEEFREKSTVNDQHPVLTSSRNGLIPQSEYYGEAGRITSRDNIGFHVVPPMHITYRSRSDDGLFFFNRNETGITGIVSHYYPVFRFRGDDTFFLAVLGQMRNRIGDYAVGSSQRVLSLNALRSVEVVIPPVKEQRRIAEVLSTWDRAIEATEKLIANSQAQKKALMQQLLTGKTRLPGFSGKWRNITLREIGTISSAGVDKKVVEGEPMVRLLNFVDVYKREFLFDREMVQEVSAPASKVTQCNVKKSDIFFTPSSETRHDIGLCAVAAEDMPGVVYSYHVVRLRPGIPLDLHFSAYLFQTDAFRAQTYSAGDGSGQRYVISQDAFRDMTVELPPIGEQRAIGQTLRDASLSIRSLEDGLVRLKSEKSALMQQLLTGKRRVKVPTTQEEAA